jgi:hypothetical protein
MHIKKIVIRALPPLFKAVFHLKNYNFIGDGIPINGLRVQTTLPRLWFAPIVIVLSVGWGSAKGKLSLLNSFSDDNILSTIL